MKNLKLLSKVALSFQDLNNFDERMNEILAEIGKLLDVSRIYIFLNDTEEIVSNTFEWYDQGIIPQIQKLQKVSNEKMPSFDKMLQIDGYIRSSDINDLPQDMIDTLKPQNIKSMVVNPLLIKKEIIGFIGFDECRYKREWTEEELEILNTISNLVSTAYQRRYAEEDFRKALEDNYQKLTHIIEGTRLGTWELDVQTGDIQCNDYWTSMLGYSRAELGPINMNKWDELTHPKDLITAYEMLEKHFSGKADFYECDMRIKHKDGSWIWTQARGKITKRDGDGKPIKMFGTHSDISLRKQTEKTLKDNEKRFFLALDKTEAGLWDIDLKKKTIFLSPMWKNILGYLDNEIESSRETWQKLIHPDDKEEVEKVGRNLINGQTDTYESISRFRHKDGNWRWILIRGGVLKDKNGMPSRLIGTNIDITIEHEQSLELDRFFTINLDLLCITSLEGEFIKTNKAWEDILGYSSDQLKGRNFLDFIHPDDIEKTLGAMKTLGNNEKVINFVNRYMSIDGGYRYIEWRSNSYGELIYAAARDITDRIKHEEEILEMSHRDSLTKVYNRRYIFNRAKKIMDEYIKIDKIFSICIIDIDSFKMINDNYGHQAGDYILKVFTRIVQQNLRSYDLLGRYGGEEFIIIFNDIDGQKSKTIIKRILNIIRDKTFYFNDHTIRFTFSAGISTCTEALIASEISQEEIIDELVGIADQRMYIAKNRGKNQVVCK